jgi:membrane protein implicated in regulation of membrane protease activity
MPFSYGLEVHLSEEVIMRYYIIIWLGIAACFAFIQADHALPAVLSLMSSWLVALFFKPVPRRSPIFSPISDSKSASIDAGTSAQQA